MIIYFRTAQRNASIAEHFMIDDKTPSRESTVNWSSKNWVNIVLWRGFMWELICVGTWFNSGWASGRRTIQMYSYKGK